MVGGGSHICENHCTESLDVIMVKLPQDRMSSEYLSHVVHAWSCLNVSVLVNHNHGCKRKGSRGTKHLLNVSYALGSDTDVLHMLSYVLIIISHQGGGIISI